MTTIIKVLEVGARWAPTSNLQTFGPALGPLGLLDFVLRAFLTLRPCDPCNGAIIGYCNDHWIVC